MLHLLQLMKQYWCIINYSPQFVQVSLVFNFKSLKQCWLLSAFTPGCTCCRLPPLVAMVTLISWLRWYLPGFSTVHFYCHWKLTCRGIFWDYVNVLLLLKLSSTSSASFDDSCLSQLLWWWLANGDFSYSIIPFRYISCFSTVRKSFLPYPPILTPCRIYLIFRLYHCGLKDSYFIQRIIILYYDYFILML